MSVLGLLFWPRNEIFFFFLESQFYRCTTDLHATYKLGPRGHYSLSSESPSGDRNKLNKTGLW